MKILNLACVAATIIALTSMQSTAATKGKKASKSKPLRVTVHPRRVGGYSYGGTGTLDARTSQRFFNPPSQSLGGPFDSGFFWETPRGPFGGTTPYWQ